MSPTAANSFRSIREFSELVNYLGDELDWPIETDNFEEMTFEYSAAELGLDEKTAPKFLEIRRLRPLDKNQPWGIFFIRFDDNKLPVVALRRLLSKLVLNKRSTSNSGDRASWHESDLLLISQTGSLGAKSISFAHFASNPEKTDLPILKVLGWDDDDTGLKIDYVIETLREKLIWPDNPTDSDAWRAQWRDAFTLKNREVIQSSKEMAERLGQLALAVRTRLREVLAIESEEGPIHKLMSVFKQNLISDLDAGSFSDMYAQTIAYGLLSARIINPKANTADAAHTQIPITNPFLKDLMETFLSVGGRNHSSGVSLDFDELGINEVVDLLDNTNMEAVLRDFGDRNQKEDPVMHFFEGFLQEYDSKIRKERGVFYTPQPVVSFIVRSVDEQLRTEFGLEDGLADTTTWGELVERTADVEIPEGTSPDQAFVQILDPATGTGTFPVEVIDLIYKTMTAKWQKQGNREAQIKELWNEYVPKNLLPRLHGYELMMAPYAIAHMKIGLKLYETGYRFRSDQRARIYLTNALEPAQDASGTFAFAIPALAKEAEAVNSIKRKRQFTVVIGNPPYSNFSSNLGAHQRSMINRYKVIDGQPLQERNALQLERNLNDDYIKFFALAEDCLSGSSMAIMAMITNNSWLTAKTFRGVRAQLLGSFQKLSIFDLGGSSELSGSSFDRDKDENVFDISQGVAISILGRQKISKNRSQSIKHLIVKGDRIEKYAMLTTNQTALPKFENIEVKGPMFIFAQINESFLWQNGVPFQTAFTVYAEGIKTGFDEGLIGFSDFEVRQKIQEISDILQRPDYLFEKYKVGQKGWANQLLSNQEKTADLAKETSEFVQFSYRPLDFRFVPWPSKLLKASSSVAGKNLKRDDGICLILANQVDGPSEVTHFFVSRKVPDARIFYSKKGTATYYPLYQYSNGGLVFDKRSCISSIFGKQFAANLGLTWDEFKEGDFENYLGSEEILHYCYALFHSPYYRSSNMQSLTSEAPRIFLPKTLDLFKQLVCLGRDLVNYHLLESKNLENLSNKFFGSQRQVEKVGWTDENGGTVWINGCGNGKNFKSGTSGFSPVSKEIWNFHIGGYKVCEKWLKYRSPKKGKPGRTLTDEDIGHYHKLIFAVGETIHIMAKIDDVININGGWPDSFAAPVSSRSS